MDTSNNTCYQFNECSVDGMCHKNANCHGFKFTDLTGQNDENRKNKIQVVIKVGYNLLDPDLYGRNVVHLRPYFYIFNGPSSESVHSSTFK